MLEQEQGQELEQEHEHEQEKQGSKGSTSKGCSSQSQCMHQLRQPTFAKPW